MRININNNNFQFCKHVDDNKKGSVKASETQSKVDRFFHKTIKLTLQDDKSGEFKTVYINKRSANKRLGKNRVKQLKKKSKKHELLQKSKAHELLQKIVEKTNIDQRALQPHKKEILLRRMAQDLKSIEDLFNEDPSEAATLIQGQIDSQHIQEEAYTKALGIPGIEAHKIMNARIELAAEALSGRKRKKRSHAIKKEVVIDNETYTVRLCGGNYSNPSIRISKGKEGDKGTFKEYFYSADDNDLTEVAVLKLNAPDDATHIKINQNELEIHRELSQKHVPNIPKLFDADESTIIMENLTADGIKTFTQEGATTAEVLKIGQKVAATLAKMHELGYVHLDLKPENIMLLSTKEDRVDDVRLIDFGLVTKIDSREALAGGIGKGTPTTIAPEVWISGRGSVTGKADIFSLGATLFDLRYKKVFNHGFGQERFYEFLESWSGLTSDQRTNEYKRCIGTPKGQNLDELDQFILQMLSPTPAERPTAKKVQEQLGELLWNLPS